MARIQSSVPTIPRFAACVFLLLLCQAGIPVAADDAPGPLDDSARSEILNWVMDSMSSRYVDAEAAQQMAAELQSRAKVGAYAHINDPAALLHALEQDLRSVSNDKHVRLWLERPEQVKEADADYTPADPDYVAHLRRTNYGYKRIEILPGNVGYLRIDEFAHSALGGPTTVAVMNALANSDALIIDLRWNGGGAGMVALICGYFFDEPTRLNDVWERASDVTLQTWTPEYVPGPSLSQVPLYILTSGTTFSAAEDFAYALKHLGRAKVVGERSRGGGHPVEVVRLVRDDMAVAMMVPNAMSLNHITGTSWEGVGVEPDLEVPASEALATAYHAALEELLEGITDEQERRRIEWARLQFNAAQSPIVLSLEQLEAYSGIFGTRTFLVTDDGVLLYRRDADSVYPLVPMGHDLFRFEGYDALRFQFARNKDGRVDRVVALYSDGRSSVALRTE